MRKLREIAELALVAHRSAERTGQTYRLDHNRLKLMGYTSEEIGKVESVVREIIAYSDERLSVLS